MAKKERVLTILVPIKDGDYTEWNGVSAPTLSDFPNLNTIYKFGNLFYRKVKDEHTGVYSVTNPIDREFPYIGKPLEIFDFTYDAVRMGNAPTVSAQGVMWYADKDEYGKDITLEDLWSQECHITFNGENFYLKQIPTSGKDNEDARYRYDIDFVSERVALENVYLYDVVQPFVSEKPIAESAKFSFYGDITELAKRINASLIRCGLCSLVRKRTYYIHEGESSSIRVEVPYITYSEWANLAFFRGQEEITERNFMVAIYRELGGDYNTYLRKYIYENVNGDFVLKGYQCKIGRDKKGVQTTSEEKLITFDNNTIHEALQQFYDTFELQYYISREKDTNGTYTGNTDIWVADCEHDFAETNSEGTDFLRDTDSVPTSEHPFDYGMDDALLSKEKANTTDKIITRITGVGSTENIPWYYPNPTADGWIRPIFKRNGIEQGLIVDYPTAEGVTTAENVRYEKYLKNRIGVGFVYGHVVDTITRSGYSTSLYPTFSEDTENPSLYVFEMRYAIHTKYSNGNNMTSPSIHLDFSFASDVERYKVILRDNTANTQEEYDSVESYDAPTQFQSLCMSMGADAHLPLTAGHTYYLIFGVWLSMIPKSQDYDFSGYLYPAVQNWQGQQYRVLSLRQDFYESSDLSTGNVNWSPNQTRGDKYYPNILFTDGLKYTVGYCRDDVPISPISRAVGKKYRDITIDTQTGQPKNDIYICNSDTPNVLSAYEIAEMDAIEWIDLYFNISLKVWDADGWYLNQKKVDLADYGMSMGSTPSVTDTIDFRRIKYVTPQANLMPEVYIKTDGERRFYEAKNYEPLRGGTPDAVIGEELDENGNVINPIFKAEDSAIHYDFENEFINGHPKEHIETFDDVKPTIKGQTNTVNGQTIRIDVVEAFAYDETDNNEIWEDVDNESGEYKHPYFFAKLRPLGFNLFDLALQEDMVLSLTTGHCGACNFKIAVDENTKKNPVQIWEHDVYRLDNGTYTKVYDEGDIRRVIDTSCLYYHNNNGYVLVDSYFATAGFLVHDIPITDIINSRQSLFQSQNYSVPMVLNGEVGSLKQKGKKHFVGDVKTNGRFIASQQDTSENYVWVALQKDTDTYGVLMPSARPDYGDDNFSVYIRPKSFADTQSEEDADKFVLTNIRLPQTYLRRAERELSKKIVAYMYDNNYQKFNFSIKFSRIFLAQNEDVDVNLNENSVLYVTFNDKTYRQYVKHYTYKMSKSESLPEIDVDMNEELSVYRTLTERMEYDRNRMSVNDNNRFSRALSSFESRVARNTIGRNSDVVVGGSLVSREAATSFAQLNSSNRANADKISETKIDLDVNHFKKEDFTLSGNSVNIGSEISVPTKLIFNSFVSNVNTFNTGVSDRIKQIRTTIEARIPQVTGGSNDNTCITFKFNENTSTGYAELLWYDANGNVQSFNFSASCPTTNGMSDISWNNFNY